MLQTLLRIFGRRRAVFVWLLPALALLLLFLTDPDKGASTGIWIVRVLTAVVAGSLAHLATKAEHDYDEADRKTLFGIIRDAPEHNPGRPIGAGLALIAEALIFLAFILLFAGQVRADTLEMQRARQYLPTLSHEVDRNWPDDPQRELLAALISHESACPRPSQCWRPDARLKSSREEGAGFGQITRAYRKDGSVRMDALADLRERHPALREWSWENVYQRPDLQLRALVLMARDNFLFFRRLGIAVAPSLAFADAGYNGGNGGVQRDRRACKLAAACDPGQWFGNVELHCTKDRTAIYGQRSACDINRFHVRDVLLERSPRYRGLV